jgi:hypothetical protein
VRKGNRRYKAWGSIDMRETYGGDLDTLSHVALGVTRGPNKVKKERDAIEISMVR